MAPVGAQQLAVKDGVHADAKRDLRDVDGGQGQLEATLGQRAWGHVHLELGAESKVCAALVVADLALHIQAPLVTHRLCHDGRLDHGVLLEWSCHLQLQARHEAAVVAAEDALSDRLAVVLAAVVPDERQLAVALECGDVPVHGELLAHADLGLPDVRGRAQCILLSDSQGP
eukprot:UN4207